MSMKLISTLARASIFAACAFLAGTATAQTMRGGGFVSGFTQECEPGWDGMTTFRNFPRVYYRPSEWNPGLPSQVILDYTDGSIVMQREGALEQSTTFQRTAIQSVTASSWGLLDTGFYRARSRVLRRIIQVPAGGTATMNEAEEVFLRIVLRDFGGRPGCQATLTATVAGSPPSQGGGAALAEGLSAFGDMGSMGAGGPFGD